MCDPAFFEHREQAIRSRRGIAPHPPARRAWMRSAMSAACALALSGCLSLAPHYVRPASPAPDAYPADTRSTSSAADGQAATATLVVPSWHEYFVDPRLRTLIDEALANNRDLRVATARIEEAGAVLGIHRAAQFPTIDATASLARFRLPGGLLSPNPIVDDLYDVGLMQTNWEIDLWGRLRNMTDSAREAFFASEAARRAVALNLISRVADAYFTVCELDERIDYTRQTIASREASLHMFRRRYEVGATSKLDLEQSEILLEQARSLGAQLEQARAAQAHSLDVLVGAPAGLGAHDQPLNDAAVAPSLAAGLPSALLEARPDILAAEHQLRAANADIGAARAAFFPRIALTSSIGTSSTDLDRLFSSSTGAWTFIPNLALPIFDAGSNRSNLALAKARRDEALAQYDKTIQGAFRDVADALSARAWLTEQVKTARATLTAQMERARLARLRYDDGATPFLEVLEAQRDLLNAEQQLVQTRRALLSSRVALYAALGGATTDHLNGGGDAGATGRDIHAPTP